MVLDGKVSTEIGKSFVRIYQLNEDGTRTSFDDFDIRILDSDGHEFSFTTQDSTTNLFVPGAFDFVGNTGVGYKVIAKRPNGIVLESDFDVVAEEIDFDFEIGDTTVVISTESGQPVIRPATTAIANVDINKESIYSKMDFEYRYVDFFTNDSVTVKEEDFVLFYCDDTNECKSKEDVTAGFTTRFEWFFILRNRFCDSLASVSQVNFVENCEDDQLTMGCCEYRAAWPTLFQLNVEALSKESFEFWEDLQKISSSNGLVLDTFPFPLKGNVTCTGCPGNFFGLLRASSETSKERIVIL